MVTDEIFQQVADAFGMPGAELATATELSFRIHPQPPTLDDLVLAASELRGAELEKFFLTHSKR